MAKRALSALLLSALCVSPVQAQEVEEDLLRDLRHDLSVLGVNLPVWMSRQLPSMMAPVGIGAGSGIGSESGGFSLGLLTRVGLMNNFDDVSSGLRLVDLSEETPSILPWPQFGAVVGVNLGGGFELGGDFQFIPAMDLAAENINLKAKMVAAAVTLRWRVNKAKGLVPAFVLGLGGSYYHGDFSVAGGYDEPYSESIDGQEVVGNISINAAPGVSWSLFQLSPELRLAWDIGGIFRPYLGVGLGLTFGEVSNKISVRAQATVESIDGRPTTRDPVVYEDFDHLYSVDAAKWSLRPHLGFDLVLGVLALTFQADLAVTGQDRINTDVLSGIDSFDLTSPDFLYNRQAASSSTDATFIGTFAARIQF